MVPDIIRVVWIWLSRKLQAMRLFSHGLFFLILSWYNQPIPGYTRMNVRGKVMQNGNTVAKVAERLKCHPNTVKRIEKRLNLLVKRDYRNYRVYSEEVIQKIIKYMSSES